MYLKTQCKDCLYNHYNYQLACLCIIVVECTHNTLKVQERALSVISRLPVCAMFSFRQRSMLSTIDCTIVLCTYIASFIVMFDLWRGYVGLRLDMINYDLIYYPEPISNYQKVRHNLKLIEQVPTLNKSGIGKDNKNTIVSGMDTDYHSNADK